MLYSKNGLKFYFYGTRVTFRDVNDSNKIKETYVHDLSDINHFVRQTHITDLNTYVVEPTEEQSSRLEVLNSLSTITSITHFAAIEFVKNGIIVPNSPLMDLPEEYHTDSLLYIKKQVVSKIREIRKIKENEGVMLERNGEQLFVRTDVDTQAKLASAKIVLDDKETFNIESFDWELLPFVWDIVDREKIIMLSKIVFQHVQSCFTISKEEQFKVNSCNNISELLRLSLRWIDIKTVYPVNLFANDPSYDYDDSAYDYDDSAYDIDDSTHDIDDSTHDIDEMNVDEFDRS